MHRIIVEEKRWIGETRFLHALNYCMLLPGPEAQQLAIYIGWLLHKTQGGLVAGILFVLPGVVAIMALSWIYAIFGNVGAVQALFFGLKAAVLAIVLEAVVRIGRRALKNNVMVGLAAAAFIALFFFHVPFPLVILAAGVIGFVGGRAGWAAFLAGNGHGKVGGKQVADADTALGEGDSGARASAGQLVAEDRGVFLLAVVRACPRRCSCCLGPAMSSPTSPSSSRRWRWSPSAAPTPCSPMSRSRPSSTYGWLKPGEMLDGLGMAETTPGPLIMVTQFVGFMGAYRAPGIAQSAARRHARRPSHDLGHLRPLLPLDLPRRAVHRDAAQQQGPVRGAVDDHRGGGRRDPEPRGLVRASCPVRRTA